MLVTPEYSDLFMYEYAKAAKARADDDKEDKEFEAVVNRVQVQEREEA